MYLCNSNTLFTKVLLYNPVQYYSLGPPLTFKSLCSHKQMRTNSNVKQHKALN